MRNRKGWVRLIEILLAAALVFVFITFIQTSQLSQYSEKPKWDAANLKTLGEDAIRTLDLKDDLGGGNGKSDLRDYIVPGGNLNPVKTELDNLLPPNVGYAIYLLNSSYVAYSSAGTLSHPAQKEKVSVSYVVAGDGTNPCIPGSGSCIVKLVLWYKT
jgi:hypothetical protein